MTDYPGFKQINFNDKWPIKLMEHLAVMQVDQTKFWEKERMAHMYTAIRPDDTILDIGACNGEMSVVFASWLGDKGRMILVEPAPHFWPVIKGHFDANGLTPYQCFPVLVSNETTDDIMPLPFPLTPSVVRGEGWPTAALTGEVNPELGFAHLNDHAPNEPHVIPIMKIDDMKLDRIDIVTIDIEGSEYEALQGAEQTIKRDHPILFVSVHPEMLWREHHHSPDDLHVMLAKWGYDGTYLAFDHEQHWEYKHNPNRKVYE